MLRRGTQIPVAMSPKRQNFVRWHSMFLGPRCGTCFLSTFLAPTILPWLRDFFRVSATLTFRIIAESLSVSGRLFDRTLGTKKCQIWKWQRQRSPLKEIVTRY
jgi:hypothetical protein